MTHPISPQSGRNSSLIALKSLSLAMLAGSCLLAPTVQAGSEPLLEYQASGGVSSLLPAFSHEAIQAGPLTMGAGLSVSGSSSFNASQWDITSTSFEQAVLAEDYWQLEIVADHPISFDSMSIRLDRSASGPDDFEIRAYWGLDNEASIFGFDFNDSSQGIDFLDLDLSAIDLFPGESLTMVIAAFNSESSGGTFDMEALSSSATGAGLQVYGEVAPVPLPAAAWAFLSGLIGLGCVARRPKQSDKQPCSV